MNSEEGISLAKMSVGVLLFTLLVSGVMLMWYMLYYNQNKLTASWEQSAVSAAHERLNDLVTQSDHADAMCVTPGAPATKVELGYYPLVTNIANALSEDSLVFVSIYDSSTATTEVFAYSGTESAFGSSAGFNVGTGGVNMHYSIDPISQATTYLLKHYHNNRCKLRQINVGYESNTYVDRLNEEAIFLAYDVTVYNQN